MRPMILMLFFAAFATVFAESPAIAQDDVREVQVKFDAGATGTTIEDQLSGWQTVSYIVGAEAGQAMQVSLQSKNTATYFNVYAPGRRLGDEAMAVGSQTGPLMPDINRFDATLPVSGSYVVSVYLYRNAARRGERSDFELDISVTGALGDAVQADFADGLQGGPDFWRVQVSEGGLKMHSSPTASAPVVMTLPNGLELRNQGCRMQEARRWCKVSTPEPEVEGWVAGEFLVESSGEMATQLPDMGGVGDVDALVPGTNYHATGTVTCYPGMDAPESECAFGVIREGNGTGSITITLPSGKTRTLIYDGGVPVAFDEAQSDGEIAFDVSRQGDAYLVFVGTDSFLVPDALIYGG